MENQDLKNQMEAMKTFMDELTATSEENRAQLKAERQKGLKDPLDTHSTGSHTTNKYTDITHTIDTNYKQQVNNTTQTDRKVPPFILRDEGKYTNLSKMYSAIRVDYGSAGNTIEGVLPIYK